MGEYWSYALTAIALVMVIEGILPFLSPQSWRQMMLRAGESSDHTLRMFGLISMVLGAFLMAFVHSGIIN